MSTNVYNSADVNTLSKVFKLMGEPNRLRILCALGLECRPVTDIIEATGLSQTNVSFHLRSLREGGMVRAERRGPFVYYCLPDSELLAIVEGMKRWLAKHNLVKISGRKRRAAGA